MDYTLDTIYLMDAFELLERLPDAAADLILTDPPYGIGYQNQFTQSPHPEIIGDGIKECDFDYEHMAWSATASSNQIPTPISSPALTGIRFTMRLWSRRALPSKTAL